MALLRSSTHSIDIFLTATHTHTHNNNSILSGDHYWYNITEDIDCDDIFPIFALYQDGTMVAFGWSFSKSYSNSDRWEHPVRPLFGVSCVIIITCTERLI